MTIKSILDAKGRNVETIGPDTTVDQASRLMRAKRIGALVVVDDSGRIAGIVSDRGLLWELVDHGVAVLQEPLSRVMTKQVVTCSECDEVSSIMGVMTERRIRHIPVVDDDGRLGGLVSIGDAVKHRLDQIEHEAEAMREYIVNAR
ncbi:MAG TPA: CBS domain-containing protein [Geminicoccaceae bacterium]|nr:CBS domain-containing protein [Geminicoccus sp.]HMU51609.1 CBS domain-containing protein [Geminicoccaceae bacterium]